jgi:hypothetical protein
MFATHKAHHPDLTTLTCIIMVTLVKMDEWTSEVVSKWLHTDFGISEKQAEVFKDQGIDGSILLDFTEDRLKDAPFSLKVGPAMKIMKRIQEFKNAAGKVLLLFAFNWNTRLSIPVCAPPA